jgi:hypothetical protein
LNGQDASHVDPLGTRRRGDSVAVRAAGAWGLIARPAGTELDVHLLHVLRSADLGAVRLDAVWRGTRDDEMEREGVLLVPEVGRSWLVRVAARYGLAVAHHDPDVADRLVVVAPGREPVRVGVDRPDRLAVVWAATRDGRTLDGFVYEPESAAETVGYPGS